MNRLLIIHWIWDSSDRDDHIIRQVRYNTIPEALAGNYSLKVYRSKDIMLALNIENHHLHMDSLVEELERRVQDWQKDYQVLLLFHQEQPTLRTLTQEDRNWFRTAVFGGGQELIYQILLGGFGTLNATNITRQSGQHYIKESAFNEVWDHYWNQKEQHLFLLRKIQDQIHRYLLNPVKSRKDQVLETLLSLSIVLRGNPDPQSELQHEGLAQILSPQDRRALTDLLRSYLSSERNPEDALLSILRYLSGPAPWPPLKLNKPQEVLISRFRPAEYTEILCYCLDPTLCSHIQKEKTDAPMVYIQSLEALLAKLNEGKSYAIWMPEYLMLESHWMILSPIRIWQTYLQVHHPYCCLYTVGFRKAIDGEHNYINLYKDQALSLFPSIANTINYPYAFISRGQDLREWVKQFFTSHQSTSLLSSAIDVLIPCRILDYQYQKGIIPSWTTTESLLKRIKRLKRNWEQSRDILALMPFWPLLRPYHQLISSLSDFFEKYPVSFQGAAFYEAYFTHGFEPGLGAFLKQLEFIDTVYLTDPYEA